MNQDLFDYSAFKVLDDLVLPIWDDFAFTSGYLVDLGEGCPDDEDKDGHDPDLEHFTDARRGLLEYGGTQ